MLCKQDNPAVFFTRYMGDYTQSLPPSEYSKLQVSLAAAAGRPGCCSAATAVAVTQQLLMLLSLRPCAGAHTSWRAVLPF